MKAIVIISCLVLAGCASTPRTARDYAQKQMTVAAYDRLTLELRTTRNGDTAYSQEFAADFPSVIEYGNGLFTQAYLTSYFDNQGDLGWIQWRMTTYCATNSPDDCSAAIQRVEDAEKNKKPPPPPRSELVVLVEAWDGLKPEEQEKLQEKYIVSLYGSESVGVIVDRQVENLSTPGSASGSIAGAAVGSAAYNVNSVSSNNPKNWSYSPWADLGSAILGAVVGSAADRAPVRKYRFRYGIKLLNGGVVSVDDESQSAVGYSIGACVYVKGFHRVNDALCTMTVDQLRAKLAG